MELNFDFANGLKDDRYFNAFLNIGQAFVDMEMGKKRFILNVKLDDSIIRPQRKDGKLLKWKDVVEIIEGYKQMKASGDWELEKCSCCNKETIKFVGKHEEEPVLDLD